MQVCSSSSSNSLSLDTVNSVQESKTQEVGGLDVDEKKDVLYTIVYCSKNEDNKYYSLDEFIRLQELGSTKTVSERFITFNLTHKQLSLCGLLNTAIDQDKTSKVLPIFKESITPLAFNTAMKYLQRHDGVDVKLPEAPLRTAKIEEAWSDGNDITMIREIHEQSKKESKYLDLVFDVMKGANYLEINSLIHLCAVYTSTLFKGQKIEVIDEILGPEPENKDS